MSADFRVKQKMLIRAEILAGNDKKDLIITLKKGSKLIGKSLGIEQMEDDNGDDKDVLAFMCPDLHGICYFENEEIKSVEIA